ncbi:hypothetical protein K1719_014010 [Acacia pycnantha]|nr:hypothetical protein K1719_014010 [Acacia pycnantha]
MANSEDLLQTLGDFTSKENWDKFFTIRGSDDSFECYSYQVVIGDMLRRNVRQRPHMRWRVMDMTSMQFADGTFDAVIDKGGLDALMEPELGPKLGTQYLSEVKRVLKSGGKYVCLTLAESHVLGFDSILNPLNFHHILPPFLINDDTYTIPCIYVFGVPKLETINYPRSLSLPFSFLEAQDVNITICHYPHHLHRLFIQRCNIPSAKSDLALVN